MMDREAFTLGAPIASTQQFQSELSQEIILLWSVNDTNFVLRCHV